ncbi:MAG TPA: hypothetical protein VH640_08710 [Bryobacteraceae bacterium]|jgi:hypothetical protein
MTRSLYRFLLSLHPREFREEFCGEMLWIFDEAAGTLGAMPLLADAVASLARQRFVRSGAWPYAVSVVANGTLLTVLFLWPELFGGGHPQPLGYWAEPAPPPVHYRLYVFVKPPAWEENKSPAPER